MKIGIIASGFEMFPLMETLNQYEHEYHLFCDWQMWPRGDKLPELRQERTQKALDYLTSKVDAVILAPSLELHMYGSSSAQKKGSPVILPLFRTYLLHHAFKYSIIGKLGLLCERADLAVAEDLIKSISKEYTPTVNQSALGKKFHTPFAVWKKDVRMRTYYLTTYGKRDPMVRTTLKHDLRYFHDAAVDTLIPMSRGFLFYQRLINQRTNRKKIRFHGLDAVKECFDTVSVEMNLKPSEAYQLTLHCTDTTDVLLAQKKWKWALERGAEITLKIEKVIL